MTSTMSQSCNEAIVELKAANPAVLPEPTTSLFDVYRWMRPMLDVASRRALRECSKSARATHDREEVSIHTKCSLSPSDKVSVTEISNSISGILMRGCRPDRVFLRLNKQDSDAQSRGISALACFPAADVSSVTQLAAQHFNITPGAATAAAAAAPRLASLQLAECADLGSLPLLIAATPRHTLCQLSLSGCGSWPGGLGDALATCPNLEHLTVLLPACITSATHNGINSCSGVGPIESNDSAAAVDIIPFAPVCSALTQLTQLRSLTMELKLPSYGDETYEGTRAMAATVAAASLARGISALTRLSRLEMGEGGALPHPEWRMELLHSLSGLPRLGEITWRRLECDPEVTFALSSSSSLTSLSVEKFCTVAPVTAVALAAAAIAAAETEVPAANASAPGTSSVPVPRALASAAVAAANSAAASAIQGTGRSTGRGGGGDVGVNGGSGDLSPSTITQKLQQQQQCKLLLLPLPPRLRVLRARYSGLGGVSLAALAALQLPPGLTSLELRNPKLEIDDGDVQQPAAARLLPAAALALGMGLSKLATHCPDMQVLRIINETRQRNPLAGPVGWEEANGGDDGAAGGGHTPWMVNFGKLRHLKRLTLSGLRLGRVDAETLARHLTSLEELYLVPLGSVSSSAVMVFRGMKLRRLSLPFDRHA